MKVDIIPFSTFKEISTKSNFDKLVGTQCIYPLGLQVSILDTFIGQDSSDADSEEPDIDFNKLAYCFEINNVCFYPKYTYDDPNITVPIIIVSDTFYEKYFNNNCTDHVLHIIYNIPIVKIIRLKRTEGNFPSDDSIEYLLTEYFESCSIVNLNQEFELDLYDDSKIKFQVDEITYKNEIKKDIQQRLKEMNYTLEFNTKITKQYPLLNVPTGLTDCESNLRNYEWHYNTLGNKKANLGYLVQAEVEIDFVVSEYVSDDNVKTQLPTKKSDPIPIPNKAEPFTGASVSAESKSSFSNIGRSLVENQIDYKPESLTQDEIRRRRLLFFQRSTN